MSDRIHLVGDRKPEEPRRPAVAIVGFTDHRTQAPLGDPRFEIWGMNELYRYMDITKFHRWFELHPRADFERAEGGDLEHIKALQSFPIPVYMQRTWPDIPAARLLPKEHIEEACRTTYFTSSPAWMLGLALLEGFEEIHLYGIDMAQDTEYAEQRPCIEFLLGQAVARGVKIYLPETSDILKAAAQYGFESAGNTLMLKLIERIAWLERERNVWQGRLQELERQYKAKKDELETQYHGHLVQITQNVNQLQGALDNCLYLKRSWGVQPTRIEGRPVTPDRSKDPRTAITAGAMPGAIPALPPAPIVADVVQPPAGDTAAAVPAPVGA